MKQVAKTASKHRRRLLTYGLAGAALAFLMLYRLGTLVPGLSHSEATLVNTPLGWHGIYHHPYFLPLLVLRSAVFYTVSGFGDLLARLPTTFFGIAGIASFAYIIRRWHGARTAAFATAMFATSAWTLHVSRVVSFDVMYLSAIPILICSGLLLEKYSAKWLIFYGTLVIWGMMLYTPGLIWLILMTIFWQKDSIADGWKHFSKFWQRILYVFAGIIWLPLLIVNLLRPHQVVLWLGAPVNFEAPLTILKHFGAVFVHLFVRGPLYPDIWMGKAPILDIFGVVMVVIGIYFYATHPKAFRSRQLLAFFVAGVALVALNGLVGISLLVPMLYMVAATGIAYLLHEWLKVFPLNPFARAVGISLLAVAVFLSCLYNLRSYFIAWPHNNVTKTVFRYDR